MSGIKKIIFLEEDSVNERQLRNDMKLEALVTIVSNKKAFIESMEKSDFNLYVLSVFDEESEQWVISLIEKLRTKYDEEVDILVMSSLDKKENINKIIEAGADDFVSMPLDVFYLQRKINHFLGLHHESSFFCNVPTPFSECKMNMDFKIKACYELGIILVGSVFILPGTRLALSAAIFETMGVGNDHILYVVSCERNSEGTYDIRLEFNSDSDFFYANIRSYLASL